MWLVLQSSKWGGDGGLGVNSKGGEKWMDSGPIVEMELMGLSEGLHTGRLSG